MRWHMSTYQARAASFRHWAMEPDRYGIALVLILVTIVVLASAGDTTEGQLVAASLGGITLLFILVTSRALPRTIRLASVLVVIAIALATLAVLFGHEGRNPYSVVVAMLSFVAPLVILRRLFTVETISLETVAGALCLYVLIGLCFSSIYLVLNGVAPPFFTQTTTPSSGDFIYFSYVTMATVGYGDYTAASQFGRMLAVTEALLGEIYLVGVVAILISNLGRTRPSRLPRGSVVGEIKAVASANTERESEGSPGP
jgi:hypothetical protein